MSTGLGNKDRVQLAILPRMADFAHFVVAAEEALPWERGTFLEVYDKNREESQASVFESDVVAMAMINLKDVRDTWKGPATKLLKALSLLFKSWSLLLTL